MVHRTPQKNATNQDSLEYIRTVKLSIVKASVNVSSVSIARRTSRLQIMIIGDACIFYNDQRLVNALQLRHSSWAANRMDAV